MEDVLFKNAVAYKGKLFLIVGPSGVGKGTVIRALKKSHPEFEYPISVTTRKQREGEVDGRTYHFVDIPKFEEMIENGDLLEYAVVHNKELYGTLKKPIIDALQKGKVIIREVDMQGWESIRDELPYNNRKSIFLTVPDKEDLIERIKKRGELPEEEVQRRMKSAEEEFIKGGAICDYQVPSLKDKISECVAEVEKIILEVAKDIL